MKLKDFEYHLSNDLIAQYPLLQRDQARLMVVDRQTKKVTHEVFSNLGRYLPPASVIVVNDSKVIPVRLLGRREKTGGAVEVLVLNKLSDGYSYQALLRPFRRIKIDEKIIFNGGRLYAQLKDVSQRIIRFNKKNIAGDLNKIGHMPLPPYIKRPDEQLDRVYYQTVFARHEGSVASPTAGLHFTRSLLSALKDQGHPIVKVTLHINYATFQPVKVEEITRHRMPTEAYGVSPRVWETLRQAKEQKKKIVAVGTTSCRALETVAISRKLKGETDIFIYPGFQFEMTDILLTNFHLPASTLFILVCAFGTRDLMMQAYKEAIRQKYRFYSYGDGMLIV